MCGKNNSTKKIFVDSEEIPVDGKLHIDVLGDGIIARQIEITDLENELKGYTLVGAVPTMDGVPIEGNRQKKVLYDGMAYTFLNANPDKKEYPRRKLLYTRFEDGRDGFVLVEER